VLGLAGSSGLAILLLETALLKLGFYLHGATVWPLHDIVINTIVWYIAYKRGGGGGGVVYCP